MAADNKLLGQFDLVGIPPAPRGIPQIEVTFDIDANGIVHVNAKDLGTGKQQSIKLTATTNLSDEEVEKMRKAAEQYSEQDKKKREEVEIINQADTLIYTSERLFKDFKDKVDSNEIDAVRKEVEALKKLMEPEKKDVNAIKKKLEDINEQIQKLSVEMYQKVAQEQARAQQTGTDNKRDNEGGEKPKKHDDDVVDADYEEVKDEEEEKPKKKGKKK
jgi:molecular chaperone DnaK